MSQTSQRLPEEGSTVSGHVCWAFSLLALVFCVLGAGGVWLAQSGEQTCPSPTLSSQPFPIQPCHGTGAPSVAFPNYGQPEAPALNTPCPADQRRGGHRSCPPEPHFSLPRRVRATSFLPRRPLNPGRHIASRCCSSRCSWHVPELRWHRALLYQLPRAAPSSPPAEEGSWPGQALFPTCHPFPAHSLLPAVSFLPPLSVSSLLIPQLSCGLGITLSCLERSPSACPSVCGQQPVSPSQTSITLEVAWSDICWCLRTAACRNASWGWGFRPNWPGAGMGGLRVPLFLVPDAPVGFIGCHPRATSSPGPPPSCLCLLPTPVTSQAGVESSGPASPVLTDTTGHC